MRGNHDYEFRFASTSGDVASSHGVREDEPTTLCAGEKNGKQIIIMFANQNLLRFDGTMAHEVRHGGQIARKQYGFDKTYNPYNYGVMKEVDAYRAQWAWLVFLRLSIILPNNIPMIKTPSYEEINSDFVNRIGKEYLSQELLYPPSFINEKVWNIH